MANNKKNGNVQAEFEEARAAWAKLNRPDLYAAFTKARNVNTPEAEKVRAAWKTFWTKDIAVAYTRYIKARAAVKAETGALPPVLRIPKVAVTA